VKDDVLESVTDGLLRALPVIHRRLLKIDFDGLGGGMSRHHIMIMKMLEVHGTLRVSEIGKRLMVSNSQMTHLIDRLIGLGLVERQPDTADRRVVNVMLTAEGRAVLDQCDRLLRENLRTQLSCLDDQELEALSLSLGHLGRLASQPEPQRSGPKGRT